MLKYNEMSKEQLTEEFNKVKAEHDKFKKMSLKLDISRGKSSKEQTNLSTPILKIIDDENELIASNGVDTANYGGVDGLPEMKEIYAKMLGVDPSLVIIGGNSSLNMMFDTITRDMMFGVLNMYVPWNKLDKVKFLCPAPGYDRHYAICELFGIEMLPIAMTDDGPDMDEIEALTAEDNSIKGIWCVPMYSNPSGITYSDEVVRRLANMKTAAEDFRIFWDNAYCVHHLVDNPKPLLNIMDECVAAQNPDRVYIFSSMSKVTFPGAAIAAMAASERNIKHIKKLLSIQTIGPNKINQLRHAKFLKNIDNLKVHMNKNREIVAPKFSLVLKKLDENLSMLNIANYSRPQGGYFISFNGHEGTAKRIVALCLEAGVILTPAGVTFPYGHDPKDENIRIAPTFPPISELDAAMDLFCICVKYATLELLLK